MLDSLALFEPLVEALRRYPELAVFLVLALGARIGAVRFGSVSLGMVTGSLFAGLLIGQFDIPVPGPAKTILFLLFLFANGYTVGPQFFQALRQDGLRVVALTVMQCLVALAVCVLCARLLGLDPGMAAGLLSGSLTQSPAIGTAIETIQRLPITAAEQQRLAAHVVVGDALTYVFGTVGAILFLSRIAPWLMGIDLAREAARLEESSGMKARNSRFLSAYRPHTARAYRLTNGGLAGARVADLETAEHDRRVFVARLRRGRELIGVTAETVVEDGDVLVLGGRRAGVLAAGLRFGPEVDDPELLDIPVATAIIVASARQDGRTLRELGERPEAHGLFLRRISRLGHEVPALPETRINAGDLLEIVGPQPDVDRIARLVGRVEAPGLPTNLFVLSLAVVAGGLIGVPTFPLGEVRLGLGTSVGTLLAGVVVGWLHARNPGFGHVPRPVLDLMRDLGLAAFVGINGLTAGPHFVAAFLDSGIAVLLAGVVCTLTPLAAGLVIGVRVLRMNPLLVLGACAGAQTSTPSLAAVQAASGSPIAILGYTVPYALSNILLTSWGAVIVVASA
ncbi:aspartate-alanine antiporter [Azospirillum doebereinerae]